VSDSSQENARTVFRAPDLSTLHAICDPERALVGGKAHPYHVDLSSGRGNCARLQRVTGAMRAAHEVARQTGETPVYQRILLTGHTGTGKSTELSSLTTDLEAAGFHVVRFSAQDEFNLSDVGWSDVLIEVAHQIWDQTLARRQQLLLSLPPGPSLIEAIDRFLERTTVTAVVRHQTELQAEGEVALGGPVWVARLRAAYKSLWKSGSERVREIRRELEPHAEDLHRAINALIGQVERLLQKAGKQGLVVVVDDLEKMRGPRIGSGPHSAVELFVDHARDLQGPNCHIIYTVPLALLYNNNLPDLFPQSQPYVIPMIRVQQRDRTEDSAGTALLEQLLRKRAADLDTLMDPEALLTLIRLSGGHLRDYLRLVRLACNYALDEEKVQVTQDHALAAIIEFSDSTYDRLARGEVDNLKRVAGSQRVAAGQGQLLQNLLVLEYNDGRTWNDIHPCVLELPGIKAELGLGPPRQQPGFRAE